MATNPAGVFYFDTEREAPVTTENNNTVMTAAIPPSKLPDAPAGAGLWTEGGISAGAMVSPIVVYEQRIEKEIVELVIRTAMAGNVIPAGTEINPMMDVVITHII